MLRSGLVSITFRALKPYEIVRLVVGAGLNGIEWGGDIHVPCGNIKAAKEVLQMTTEAGLEMAAYGSYYRVGCDDGNFDGFKRVLETAVALKVPTIRVWAGELGSNAADQKYRDLVVAKARIIAELAKEATITISFEFHGGTLTDTNDSTMQFYKDINHENVKAYWQPNQVMDLEQRLEGLQMIQPLLSNIHVFYWILDQTHDVVRSPLINGQEEWKVYIDCIKNIRNRHYAMIEFVKDDEPGQFLKDAEILKTLIQNCTNSALSGS